MAKIFISYARKDKDEVFPIVEELRTNGFDCWIDTKGIESGSEFEKVILDAIDSCEVFLHMLSANSKASDYVKEEYKYAVAVKKKVISIALRGAVDNPRVMFGFNSKDIIEFYKEDHKEKLIRDLMKLTGANNNVTSNYREIAKEPIVAIETDYGTMKVKLYNETPQHRDNFLKLVKEGFYNDLLFHRVIKDFMIQCGDPDSKGAPAGKQLGAGENGYQIPAEFRYPQYMHKKGALAAARMGDQVNPEKKSSGCQFYIVQGKTYSDKELESMEENMKNQAMMRKFNELKKANIDKIKSMMINKNQEGLQALQNQFVKECEDYVAAHPEECKMNDEVKKIYKEIGGTPFLDGEYTIFGEIVEGLEIVDKIAAVKTAPGDRPIKDVKMIKAYVHE